MNRPGFYPLHSVNLLQEMISSYYSTAIAQTPSIIEMEGMGARAERKTYFPPEDLIYGFFPLLPLGLLWQRGVKRYVFLVFFFFQASMESSLLKLLYFSFYFSLPNWVYKANPLALI